jgi:peptidoglycan/xylan/chitin deacetylase (PgdA/CDA1 family)
MRKTTRRLWCKSICLAPIGFSLSAQQPTRRRPAPKQVVLTFDDAVKSHRSVVAPLLKEAGFSATFFITQRWMEDHDNFLTWNEVAQIHGLGFEIGNHSWTHSDFSKPENAANLGRELEQVEAELQRIGVPKPVSFAWCGNGFGPAAIEVLRERNYRFARRGMQPEIPYGRIEVGPAFDPQKHHPLLIPTTGDAYPDWDLNHFKKVGHSAGPGELVVLQFHGIPDVAHPWVHTPPENFQQYLAYLKSEGFQTLALRDVAAYLPDTAPADPLLTASFSPSLNRVPAVGREQAKP